MVGVAREGGHLVVGVAWEGGHLARLHTVMASVWLHCRDQSTVGGGQGG